MFTIEILLDNEIHNSDNSYDCIENTINISKVISRQYLCNDISDVKINNDSNDTNNDDYICNNKRCNVYNYSNDNLHKKKEKNYNLHKNNLSSFNKKLNSCRKIYNRKISSKYISIPRKN